MKLADATVHPGRWVNLIELPDGNLRLQPTAEIDEADFDELESIPTDEALQQLLEDHIVGGDIYWISPSTIGAMTDAPIISFESPASAQKVYFHEMYATEDPVAKLRDKGAVTFKGTNAEEDMVTASANKVALDALLEELNNPFTTVDHRNDKEYEHPFASKGTESESRGGSDGCKTGATSVWNKETTFVWNHAYDYAFRNSGEDEDSARDYANFYMENYPNGDGSHATVFPYWLDNEIKTQHQSKVARFLRVDEMRAVGRGEMSPNEVLKGGVLCVDGVPLTEWIKHEKNASRLGAGSNRDKALLVLDMITPILEKFAPMYGTTDTAVRDSIFHICYNGFKNNRFPANCNADTLGLYDKPKRDVAAHEIAKEILRAMRAVSKMSKQGAKNRDFKWSDSPQPGSLEWQLGVQCERNRIAYTEVDLAAAAKYLQGGQLSQDWDALDPWVQGIIDRVTVVGSDDRRTVKIAASKPKCPHCGSTEYGLMPSDFETAKCDKCGKNWDHGIVPGINDPKMAALRQPSYPGEDSPFICEKCGEPITEQRIGFLNKNGMPQHVDEVSKEEVSEATHANNGNGYQLNPEVFPAWHKKGCKTACGANCEACKLPRAKCTCVPCNCKAAMTDDSGATTGLRRRPDYGASDSYCVKMNTENSKGASMYMELGINHLRSAADQKKLASIKTAALAYQYLATVQERVIKEMHTAGYNEVGEVNETTLMNWCKSRWAADEDYDEAAPMSGQHDTEWFQPFVSELTQMGFKIDPTDTSPDGFNVSYKASKSDMVKVVKQFFLSKGFSNTDGRTYMAHTGNPHVNLDGPKGQTVQISWHPKGGPMGVSFISSGYKEGSEKTALIRMHDTPDRNERLDLRKHIDRDVNDEINESIHPDDPNRSHHAADSQFATFFAALRQLGFRRDGAKSTAGWMYKKTNPDGREITVWINLNGRHSVGNMVPLSGKDMPSYLTDAVNQRGWDASQGGMISNGVHSDFTTVDGMLKAIEHESTRVSKDEDFSRKHFADGLAPHMESDLFMENDEQQDELHSLESKLKELFYADDENQREVAYLNTDPENGHWDMDRLWAELGKDWSEEYVAAHGHHIAAKPVDDTALIEAANAFLQFLKNTPEGRRADTQPAEMDLPNPNWGPREPSARASIRHWGNWEVPADAEGDTEDYDWEQMTAESGKKLNEYQKRFKAEAKTRFPGLNFSLESEGEKNWISISVTREKASK